MKVLIILLLLIILIYFIYLKKEKFRVLDITPELRARMTAEQLASTQNLSQIEITNTGYMMLDNESHLREFNDLMGIDHVKKFNFVQNFSNGLGFKVRDEPFPQIFNSNDSEIKLQYYSNITSADVDVTGLGENYANPNNYKYSTLFVEKFKPNVELKVNFKIPETPIRLRYEIKKKNSTKVLFSNYLYYENRAVRQSGSNFQIFGSPMTTRYEPYQSLLLEDDYQVKVPVDPPGTNPPLYSNYFKNLHKLIIDLKNCQNQRDYNKLSNKYKNGEYNIVFEDFDRIDMDKPYNCYESKKVVKDENGDFTETDLESDGLMTQDNCKEVKAFLYISPGDYTIKIVCEGEENMESKLKNDILVSMNYNFTENSLLKDKVLKNDEEPFSLVKGGWSQRSKPENLFYLKLNIDNYLEEIKTIKYITKNPDRTNTDTPLIIQDAINPIKPGRYYKYVNLLLFKTLIMFRKNMGDDDLKKFENKYQTLIDEIDLFKQEFVKQREDTRELQNPSQEYKRLESEFIQLRENANTDEEMRIVMEKAEELDTLRINELNSSQKLTEFTEKIEALRNIYKEIMTTYNNDNGDDSVKKFLENNVGVSQQTFETLLEKYLGKHLLSNVSTVFNSQKTIESMDRLKLLIDNLKPDANGIINQSQKSDDKLGKKFPRLYSANYNFKVEIKEEILPPMEAPEPIPDMEPEEEEEVVTVLTDLMRKVIRLVKKDFRKIIKAKTYDELDPELEGILKSVKRSTKIGPKENREEFEKIIKLITNLIEKIRDGSIDDINDLLEIDVDSYEYPNEVLVENFSNINIMRPLHENFIGDVDLHKHTSEGRINFSLDWGNPLEKANQGRYDEYGLLSDESKKNVLDSYSKVENVVTRANGMVNDFVTQMEQKVQNVDYNKIDSETNKSIEQIEKTQEDIDKLYLDTESKQNEKIARISEKVKELEKLQNKKYLGDMESFNSLKSFGDGQVISVQNLKKDIYSILVNDECLEYDKKKTTFFRRM